VFTQGNAKQTEPVFSLPLFGAGILAGGIASASFLNEHRLCQPTFRDNLPSFASARCGSVMSRARRSPWG